MAATLTPIQTNILGAAIIELLNGELSDETIAAIDSIKREDVPEALSDLVGMIHGMSTMPEQRQGMIEMLLDEIRIASQQLLEKKYWQPGDPRASAWGGSALLLKKILQGGDADEIVQGVDKDMLPDVEQAPEWARPLIQHAQGSSKEGNELTLELLDELEKVIQKRKAELAK